MPLPVCCVGDRFEGFCRVCDHTVQGTMMTGEFPRIEDRNVCVTGSLGRGDCGHTCTSVGRSQVLFIEGKPVVRVGDPVTGEIEGRLVTGSDFVFSD